LLAKRGRKKRKGKIRRENKENKKSKRLGGVRKKGNRKLTLLNI
jgi:hypothetical protein